MNIGFIGCGNMAKAIIKGMLREGIFSKEAIFATALNQEKLQAYCNQMRINAVKDNQSLVTKCDVVILAVKPQKFEEVFAEIENQTAQKLIISIAAGKTLEYIQNKLNNKNARIARVMPNLNATIALSQTAVCFNEFCLKSDIECVKRIFSCIGAVYEIDESNFSAFSACACCSPAFSFMYINALAQAAQKLGLDKDIAYQCATGSVLGSAEMLEQSNDCAEELIKKVCSPGGTTIEGVNALKNNAFENVIEKAVIASYEKDKLL